jgi:hypothetical protein
VVWEVITPAGTMAAITAMVITAMVITMVVGESALARPVQFENHPALVAAKRYSQDARLALHCTRRRDTPECHVP